MFMVMFMFMFMFMPASCVFVYFLLNQDKSEVKDLKIN